MWKLGFSTSEDVSKDKYDKLKDTVNEELKKAFRPEFLNRLDDIVSFHQLKPEHLRQIVEIHLNKLLKRAKALNYLVTVDKKAKDWFVDEVFTSKFGVRALKRLIQEQVETPLSMLIMQDRIHPGQPVFLNVDESGRKLRVYAKAATPNSPALEIKTPEKLPEPEDEVDIEAVEKEYSLIY